MGEFCNSEVRPKVRDPRVHSLDEALNLNRLRWLCLLVHRATALLCAVSQVDMGEKMGLDGQLMTWKKGRKILTHVLTRVGLPG